IENNRRRIEILEEMARLLYREWFVHFRFPGHENFELVDSNLGPIPEAWDLVALGAVLEFHGSGATPKGGKDSYNTDGVPLVRSMNVYDLRFEEKGLAFIDASQAADLQRVTIEADDVLLNITGASVARCSLAPPSVTGGRVNQHVMILRLDRSIADPMVVAQALAGPYKSKLLSIAGSGATREALTKADVETFKVFLPPPELQSDFRRQVEPMGDLGNILGAQNRVLREARDLLLPRLVSGELDVSDLDLDGVLA
ncbi:MAG: hypothetical protein GY788_11935, partial [bacterium]|nr:hypothetical protein [bacterium]